jgi:hypothetical protein
MVNESDREFVRFADSAEDAWSTLVENGLIAPRSDGDRFSPHRCRIKEERRLDLGVLGEAAGPASLKRQHCMSVEAAQRQ